MSTKAELFLYKSILKSKPIVSAPAFPSYILAKVEAAAPLQDVAHANVQARLFNSNIVKEAMANILNETRAALEIRNEDSVGKKRRLRAVDYTHESQLIKQASPTTLGPEGILATKDEGKSDGQTQSLLKGIHGELDATNSDNESVNLAAYEDRLAESENDSTQEIDLQKSSTEHKEFENSPSRDITPSPSRSMSPSSSVPDNPKPRKVSTITPESTIFLPSLTMGGYISDSDSAISDPSFLLGNATTRPRKNRRGQRERRQIWEKKYGKNANHVKRQGQQQQQNRDQDWEARKGAVRVGGDDRGKRGRGRGRGRVVDVSARSSTQTIEARAADKGGAEPFSSGANSDPIRARRKGKMPHDARATGNQTAAAAGASAPLHPSWEAAKRRKEAKKNVAFQGKKVVFN